MKLPIIAGLILNFNNQIISLIAKLQNTNVDVFHRALHRNTVVKGTGGQNFTLV